MVWQTFDYSKKQVDRAARKLVDNNIPLEKKLENIAILANFRSAHAYPMQSMLVSFRKQATSIDKKAIVVQRLKRIPSIIGKLKRYPKMQASKMGDIGGIRIIFNDVKKVCQLQEKLKKWKTKNKLVSERNYLESPKSSGYRSIHFIYSYQNKKKNYQGFKVELQIRSAIQHAWATAVEIVGTFYQQNLKASDGDQEWLDFFNSVSQAFACLEQKQKINKDLQKEISTQIKILNIFDILAGFTIAAKYSDKKDGYYLLQLDIKNQKVSVRFFTTSFLLEAYQEYRRIEQEISEDPTQDVVLVAARSLTELKKAYPNYFADTRIFIQNLKKITES